jgi:hypothetical protein
MENLSAKPDVSRPLYHRLLSGQTSGLAGWERICGLLTTTCSTGVAHSELHGVHVDTSTFGYPLLTALRLYRVSLISFNSMHRRAGKRCPTPHSLRILHAASCSSMFATVDPSHAAKPFGDWIFPFNARSLIEKRVAGITRFRSRMHEAKARDCIVKRRGMGQGISAWRCIESRLIKLSR